MAALLIVDPRLFGAESCAEGRETMEKRKLGKGNLEVSAMKEIGTHADNK